MTTSGSEASRRFAPQPQRDEPAEGLRPDESVPVYVISVAAQISGLHPQTLRQYDRLGLVSPDRTMGRNRLYSLRDVGRLREVSRLSAEGVNLAGISRILQLEFQLHEASLVVGALRRALDTAHHEAAQEASGRPSTALVVWRPRPADRHPR